MRSKAGEDKGKTGNLTNLTSFGEFFGNLLLYDNSNPGRPG